MKLNGHSNIEYNLPSSKPSVAKTNIVGTIYDSTNKFWELEEGDTPSVLVNAVEIDWNGANLKARKAAIDSEGIPNSIELPEALNTTGELLDIIAQQQAQIDALILMVKGLYVGLAATN